MKTSVLICASKIRLHFRWTNLLVISGVVLKINTINKGFFKGKHPQCRLQRYLDDEKGVLHDCRLVLRMNKYGQIKHYECRLRFKIKMSSTRLYKNVYSIE